jgi:hypothetical protein
VCVSIYRSFVGNMSSNPSYRDGRRDFQPRGGGGYRGGRGGGRGGFANKQRRYWDNDDLYDKVIGHLFIKC